jgi:hypothetical protein
MHVGQQKGGLIKSPSEHGAFEEPSPFLRWIVIAVSIYFAFRLLMPIPKHTWTFTSHGANSKASRFVGSSNFTVTISSPSESESIHDRLVLLKEYGIGYADANCNVLGLPNASEGLNRHAP